MRTLRTIFFVLLGFAVTATYLFQRDVSLRLVRRQARQEARLRVLGEERDRLRADCQLLTSFGRVDSVWQAASRSRRIGAGLRTDAPPLAPAPDPDQPEAVAAAGRTH
ncbi:MAG TPA: hypothetical protein ENN51_01525 [candidate division WOR-3 bacterium]|uniref:Cell division protein FtsL n=1 Tax=candidate division WOR-3 bacterium TaxID=2052148 RepID=A0A7V0T530_UNCW3|nr:hypothetical protein [candidate division WOR-3 bacterium]